jgi:flagellar hook-basal body complex protein FliE
VPPGCGNDCPAVAPRGAWRKKKRRIEGIHAASAAVTTIRFLNHRVKSIIQTSEFKHSTAILIGSAGQRLRCDAEAHSRREHGYRDADAYRINQFNWKWKRMEPIQLSASKLQGEVRELVRLAADLAGPQPARLNDAGDVNFTKVLGGVMKDVDNRQLDAAEKAADVDSGKSDDVIGAVLANQEASLSFSMLTQVRNKLTAALDDLLKMPI